MEGLYHHVSATVKEELQVALENSRCRRSRLIPADNQRDKFEFVEDGEIYWMGLEDDWDQSLTCLGALHENVTVAIDSHGRTLVVKCCRNKQDASQERNALLQMAKISPFSVTGSFKEDGRYFVSTLPSS